MSQPVILLIPGSFGVPEFYDNVVEAVAAANVQIKGLHLPSVGTAPDTGRDGAPSTMYDDAAFIAEEITKLADGGKEVVLVAHSYGGIPATECARGLARRERQQNGKPGGLVRIAYLTALVPDVGKSAMDILAQLPAELQPKMDIDVGLIALGTLHTIATSDRRPFLMVQELTPDKP